MMVCAMPSVAFGAEVRVRAMSLSVGATGGIDFGGCDCPDPDYTWSPTMPSPMFAADFEWGWRWLRADLGFFSAPTASHRLVVDVVSAPVAMGVVGVLVGTDEIRGGPYGSFGIAEDDLGLRVVYTPFVTKQERAHGFDFRIFGTPFVYEVPPRFQSMLFSLGWTWNGWRVE